MSDKIAAIASFVGLLQFVALILTYVIMRGTAIRQLRAYCLIARAEVLDVELGKAPKARITIKNFGQTPAKNFKTIAVLGYDTFPISRLPNPDFEHAEKVQQPLPPDGYFDIWPKLSEEIKIQKHIDDLKDGKAAIYAIGEISYIDAFGIERFTRFKVFCGGPIGYVSSGMSAYFEGNDYS